MYDASRDPRLKLLSNDSSSGNEPARHPLQDLTRAFDAETWSGTASSESTLPSDADTRMSSSPEPGDQGFTGKSLWYYQESRQDTVEYVKGVGRVVHPRTPSPDPVPPSPPPSRTDCLSLFVDENHHCTSGTIKWDRGNDKMVFTDGDIVAAYDADDIKHVEYIFGDRPRFCFATEVEGVKRDLFIIGLVKNEIAYAMIFRSSLDGRFKCATSCSEAVMSKRQQELERRRALKCAIPTAPSGKPTLCCDTSPRHHSPRDGNGAKRGLDALSPVSPSNRASKDKVHGCSNGRNALSPVSPTDRISKAKHFDCSKGRAKDLAIIKRRMIAAPDQLFRHSATAVVPPANALANASSNPASDPTHWVKKGDYVFRLRERCKFDDVESCADDLDIYDGPFLVKSLWNKARTFEFLGSVSIHSPAQQGIVAELVFPKESNAIAQTSISRLRRALKVPVSVPIQISSKKQLFDAAVSAAANTSNASTSYHAPLPRALISPNMLFAGKLTSIQHVTGTLTSPECLGDDTYNIDRLRRKRITIGLRRDYENEPESDEEVVKYVREHGPVPVNKVLVVEYLVHWAGWPSEDDTWERAFGNISAAAIAAFAARHRQKTIMPFVRPEVSDDVVMSE